MIALLVLWLVVVCGLVVCGLLSLPGLVCVWLLYCLIQMLVYG